MFLHVIPQGAAADTYGGTYKDLLSRVAWFRDQPIQYRQCIICRDDVADLGDLPPADAVRGILVEYTHYPRIVAALRERYPTALLAVRAHNVEPLQHLDNHGWFSRYGPLWMLYGMWRLLCQDVRCKRTCDVVYAISEHEVRNYWRRLPGRARIEWLPYFCPDSLLPRAAPPLETRRVIGCLPASLNSRRNWDLARRFIRFAEALKAHGANYRFVLTGDLAGWGLPQSSAVEYAGMIENLGAFLGGLRAVAVLSPLGRGFKTTIADALAAGVHVVAHPVWVDRCPESFAPGLVPLRTERLSRSWEIERVLARLEGPFPLAGLNERLKGRSLGILGRDFAPRADAESRRP